MADKDISINCDTDMMAADTAAHDEMVMDLIRRFGADWQQASDKPLEEREGYQRLLRESQG